MDREEKLRKIIIKYREELQKKIRDRKEEMKSDNNEHYILYNALGFSDEKGYQIDYQQNVGRFLYKYAGSLIEDLAIRCFKLAHPDAREKVKIPNTIDQSPKNVEIDCLVGKRAYEIKWKDATTDGDHIKKEHKRVKVISEAGYIPIRIMFFEPNREQAIRIQAKLRELYQEIGGEYYSGEDAWEYLKNDTGIDLKRILERMDANI
ncbi:MAG: ApaLI family restriction endonuclease [Lachnospiraceae bacterium]|nr:ApaLI family restriction endonuclease [Lachnospiraceae bacterium]